MKVISLFCGCGWLDLWFHMAWHEIVYANDFDKDAINTYKNNFDISDCIVELESISNVNTSKIPDWDIVIGWFPCQGFSVANNYRTEKDERNTLYLELLRVIKDKNPKFFLAENVTGICSLWWYETAKDKKKKLWKVFKMILEDLSNIWYNVKWEILDSSDFNVPQKRKRVIIVGIRQDLPIEYIFPSPTSKEKKTVRDAIGDLPLEYSDTIPNHQWSKHKVKINGYLWNRDTDWDKPSPTITGRWWWTWWPVIMPHPLKTRRMTVREYARIQTFPDNFVFEGSISSQYRQIGNAVPPLLGMELWKMFHELENSRIIEIWLQTKLFSTEKEPVYI